jgi:hypothetical protein
MQSVGSRVAARWRRRGVEHPVARAMGLAWAIGVGVGLVCAALLLVFDIFGLRSLLWPSDIPFTGAAMLCAAFAFTFGGLHCAAAAVWIDDRGHARQGRRLRLERPPQRQSAAEPLPASNPAPHSTVS